MAKYRLLQSGGVLDQETNSYIPESNANRHWIRYLEWCAEGNVADPTYTLDELKIKKISEINTAFGNAVKNVTVTVNAIEYNMDAGEFKALKFKAGLDLAQELEEITMDIVDYNDNEILDVPIADAIQISRLVRKNYRTNWKKKNTLRQQVMSAITEEEISAISW